MSLFHPTENARTNRTSATKIQRPRSSPHRIVCHHSRFSFSIKAQSAPAREEILNLNIPQPELAGLRLLLVDDNPTNRRILTLQAKSWGMLVRAAESGAQALKVLQDESLFDLAILDFHMPEMDGITLAEKIRELPQGKSLPLMILSSGGRPSRREVQGRVEFAAFVYKPIKQAQLHEVLLRILGGECTPIQPCFPQPQFNSQLAETLPLKILLVDDVEVNQMVAGQMLQKLGYSADFASGGQAALNALEHSEYDIVFMDMQMPGMDGLETTRLIRQGFSGDFLLEDSQYKADSLATEEQSNHPKPKIQNPKSDDEESYNQKSKIQNPKLTHPWIIAMTANAMQGDRELCLDAGMNDYISKPVRVQAIVQAIALYDRQTGSSRFNSELNTLQTQPADSIPQLHPGNEIKNVAEGKIAIFSR